MKKWLLLLILLLTVVGCAAINSTDWVVQDRDDFGRLDSLGLDKWIDTYPGLNDDQREALHMMNTARRARIKRGCELVGVTVTAGG